MTDIEQARELLAKHMRIVAKKHNSDGLRRDAEVVESGEEWDFWMEAAHAAVAAALRAAPEGFALVPVNPTVEMLKAGYNTSGFASATWKDMIAASKQIETLSTVTPPRDLRTKLGEV